MKYPVIGRILMAGTGVLTAFGLCTLDSDESPEMRVARQFSDDMESAAVFIADVDDYPIAREHLGDDEFPGNEASGSYSPPSDDSGILIAAPKSNPNQLIQSPPYLELDGFYYPNEIEIIMECAQRQGINPAYMFAIREAEKGEDGLQFGVLNTRKYKNDKLLTEADGTRRPYRSKLEKQAHFAALSVKNNIVRWNNLGEKSQETYGDFFSYMGSRYSPVGGEKDDGTSKYWVRNFRGLFYKFNK